VHNRRCSSPTSAVVRPSSYSWRAAALAQHDVGCVRMTERHLRNDPPTAEQIAATVADVRAALVTASRDVRSPKRPRSSGWPARSPRWLRSSSG